MENAEFLSALRVARRIALNFQYYLDFVDPESEDFRMFMHRRLRVGRGCKYSELYLAVEKLLKEYALSREGVGRDQVKV